MNYLKWYLIISVIIFSLCEIYRRVMIKKLEAEYLDHCIKYKEEASIQNMDKYVSKKHQFSGNDDAYPGIILPFVIALIWPIGLILSPLGLIIFSGDAIANKKQSIKEKKLEAVNAKIFSKPTDSSISQARMTGDAEKGLSVAEQN